MKQKPMGDLGHSFSGNLSDRIELKLLFVIFRCALVQCEYFRTAPSSFT